MPQSSWRDLTRVKFPCELGVVHGDRVSAPQDLQSVSAAAWQEKAAYCPATHVVHAAQLAAFTPVE